MSLIARYKAGIITFLLTGIFVLGLFSIQLKQRGVLISESFYEINPEPESQQEELIQDDLLDSNSSSSDKAFNEDQEYKEMMRNFKAISANDFEQTTKALEQTKSDLIEEESSELRSVSNHMGYALKANETEAFKKLQEKLNKRLVNEKVIDKHANKRSSLTYSLKDRVLEYYKTPRYLCEFGGKIVVSIKVDSDGNVFDAYINGASSSNNQCLIESAISYAKTAKFSSSSRKNQLGTITFVFKGKG
ncbi:energy transducer TonB [Winogradskyella sp. DF17]|uniref:Energy transducer TonB n=1 Tax=Winogradskyella pelagia TaxID=2819984 RepID=A0ABS3T577_9FLAO|nr:energy transducer TonB [Winogradskyella sp. DF17]MBO3117907.1 energy transducer TonB [Winogradskyella sp. DF17]